MIRNAIGHMNLLTRFTLVSLFITILLAASLSLKNHLEFAGS